MAIGRVVSVHFYSYAPWRGVWIEDYKSDALPVVLRYAPWRGVWIENTATIKGNENLVRYAPWRGVWIENDCYCFLFMERKATPHGGAYGLKSKVSSRSLYSVLLRPMEGRMD